MNKRHKGFNCKSEGLKTIELRRAKSGSGGGRGREGW